MRVMGVARPSFDRSTRRRDFDARNAGRVFASDARNWSSTDDATIELSSTDDARNEGVENLRRIEIESKEETLL